MKNRDDKIQPVNKTPDGQHINPDGETDAEKAGRAGAIAGAVTGAVAGTAAGPLGVVGGAAIGAVAGGLGSKAVVAQVDKLDDDTKAINHEAQLDGVQTGGRAMDGTPDTRGATEKIADALTGDDVDDKTGKKVR